MIKKRSNDPGASYYADTRHKGVRLRDCLKTDNYEKAIERIGELKLLIERGEYQRGKIKFEILVKEFLNPSKRDEGIIRVHLMPEFTGQRVWDMDFENFLDKISTRQSQSSINKICATMRKLVGKYGIEVPRGISKMTPKEFGVDQILTEDQIGNVINNFVPPLYRDICWVAVFFHVAIRGCSRPEEKKCLSEG